MRRISPEVIRAQLAGGTASNLGYSKLVRRRFDGP